VIEENSLEKSAKGEDTDLENTAEIDKQVMTHLDERTRRIYAAGLAKKYGYGGGSQVHRELGLDYKTIRRGLKELEEEPLQGRRREEGGGRKKGQRSA